MTTFDKSKLPSRHVTEGPARAPHRSYYYAMGLTAEEIAQPFVGVVSCWCGDLDEGERVYVHEELPKYGATRLMLHAKELGFVHPTSGEKLHFEAELPEDMQRVLAGLGSTRGRR